MKNLFVTLLITSLTFTCLAQKNISAYHIKICPFGVGDKDGETLILKTVKSDSLISEEFTQVVVTDKTTFSTAMRFIKENDTKIIYNEKFFAGGSFNIFIYKKSKLVTNYIVKSSGESKIYFRSFIDLLTKNNYDIKVTTELRHILRRIDY